MAKNFLKLTHTKQRIQKHKEQQQENTKRQTKQNIATYIGISYSNEWNQKSEWKFW